MGKLSRRDFLKLGGGALGATLASKIISESARANQTKKTPNIILLICDAMTARNLSVYGYSRKTTPNLEKFAEQAFVYHNHYANGNFTTPGTSSLLTGLRPLTHRAVNHGATIRKELAGHNVFSFLGNGYFKTAYTQNYWANYLLAQFSSAIDDLLPVSEFSLLGERIINRHFKNDALVADRAFEKMIYYGNSLLLSFIANSYFQSQAKEISLEKYPMGLPIQGYPQYPFTMEGLFEGIKNKIIELDALARPFFSYFHVFPPHHPYRPQKDFAGMFDNDGYKPIEKRKHALAHDVEQTSLNAERNNYDAFVANLDSAIGRFMEALKERGILDRAYFIIASDHGETFERGMHGHGSPLLYEPLVRIPLMIRAPGAQTRRDFLTPTNNIDLLPTILNIAGQKIPDSCEGAALPGFGGTLVSANWNEKKR
jgi:arylsulfatase A-like enzyme